MIINKLDTTGSWAVDGSPIYVPSVGVTVEHTNIASSDSGRTEDGYMFINWIRTDIRKVSLVYSAMSGEELNTLLSKMQGKTFSFTFRDQGEAHTMNAYSGECTYNFYSSALGDDDLYTDVRINVIEM